MPFDRDRGSRLFRGVCTSISELSPQDPNRRRRRINTNTADADAAPPTRAHHRSDEQETRICSRLQVFNLALVMANDLVTYDTRPNQLCWGHRSTTPAHHIEPPDARRGVSKIHSTSDGLPSRRRPTASCILANLKVSLRCTRPESLLFTS